VRRETENISNLVGLIVVLTTLPLFAAILRIPFTVIAPVIIVICAIGAFTVNNAYLDIVLMLIFGVIGYASKSSNTRWRRWFSPWRSARWLNPHSDRR
jgi:TctA family transporter